VAANAELEAQLREVRRLNRELEAVNRELESFSYSVSHDLRGPLRRINGYSQALLEDYLDQLDEPGQQFLERIMVMCEQMGRLIDDLLKLSRVTRVKLERGPVNLSTLAERIAQECQSSTPERKVSFRIAPNIVADGDERLLYVLLENLLGNAWKFTQNHPTATIEFGVTTGESDEQVYFVRDDGAGFNMEFASHLFGAFHRLHTDSEFEGTGIGLATAQRIVHRHGGKIWAEAAVEQGATFFFTL
jgi:light-regulated signal transduction histidine kinase (bacteriophytochrome)